MFPVHVATDTRAALTRTAVRTGVPTSQAPFLGTEIAENSTIGGEGAPAPPQTAPSSAAPQPGRRTTVRCARSAPPPGPPASVGLRPPRGAELPERLARALTRFQRCRSQPSAHPRWPKVSAWEARRPQRGARGRRPLRDGLGAGHSGRSQFGTHTLRLFAPPPVERQMKVGLAKCAQ